MYRLHKIAASLAFVVATLVTLATGQGTGYNASRIHTFSSTVSDIGLKQSSLMLYHRLAWVTTGAPAACTVAVDSSVDGVVWVAGGIIAGQNCTAAGPSAIVSVSANYIRMTVTALTAGATVTATYEGWAFNPNPATPNGVTNAANSLPANQIIVGNTYPDVLTSTCTIVAGALSCPGTVTAGSGSSVAGGLDLGQGTDNGAPAANHVLFQAPTAVTAYHVTLPGAAATGPRWWSNAAGSVTESVIDASNNDATKFLNQQGAFAVPAGSTGFDPTVETFYEPFWGGGASCTGSTPTNVSQAAWSVQSAGTSVVSCPAMVASHPGIVRIVTGGTSGNLGALSMFSNGAFSADFSTNTNWTVYWVFRMNSQSTDTVTTSFYIGLMDANSVTTAPPVRFIGLRFDTSATSPSADSTTFFYATCSASTCVKAASKSVDNLWHTLKMTSSVAGKITFTLDGTNSVCFVSGGAGGCTDSTTTIPTAALTPTMSIQTRKTGTEDADADAFWMQFTGLTR